MNFETTTPLGRARNHYWLARGAISETVAGMPRRGRHKTVATINPGRAAGFYLRGSGIKWLN
ncbi:MAG: hypothetical protein ACRED2_04705, partial [Methylocella sp.]